MVGGPFNPSPGYTKKADPWEHADKVSLEESVSSWFSSFLENESEEKLEKRPSINTRAHTSTSTI